MNLKFVLRASIDQSPSKTFESPCRFVINMYFKTYNSKIKKNARCDICTGIHYSNTRILLMLCACAAFTLNRYSEDITYNSTESLVGGLTERRAGRGAPAWEGWVKDPPSWSGSVSRRRDRTVTVKTFKQLNYSGLNSITQSMHPLVISIFWIVIIW